MARSLWWVVRSLCLAVAPALVLNGCGSSPSSPKAQVQAQEDDTTVEPSCVAGPSCTCADGREGTSRCDADGGKTCDCSWCPAFSAKDEEPFDACGGRVFGQWRMTNVHYAGGGALRQTNPPSGAQPITCAENLELATDPTTVHFLLDLQDGGRAQATDLTLAGTVEFLHSCAQQIFGSVPCSQIRLDGVVCGGICGTCSCPSSGSLAGDSVRSWTTTGSQLTLSVGGSDVIYDYCVTGNQLTLRLDSLQLDFEKVLGGGVPSACGARTAATCTAGSGCHAGTCSGSGCSGYGTEATCAVHSQCGWQASGCTGTAPSSCELADYGLVPGCDFLPLGTQCTGTAKPCSDYSVADCTSIEGCATTSACEGPPWDCGALCAIGYGCYESNGGCIGTGSCGAGKAEASCYASYGCAWNTHCQGTTTACSTYGLTDCTPHPGCSLSTSP